MRRYLISWMAGILAMCLLAGCTSDTPADDPVSSATTTTTEATATTTTAPTVLPEAVENIPEGTLSAEQVGAFRADAEHAYVEYTTAKDPTVTAKPSTLEADGSFFDDFADGIDPSIWNLMNQRWGAKNNGVKRDQVYYTADGVAVLQANGDYYSGKKSLVRAGSCLITRDALGPGSYEVRMKVLPQMGTCTAIWTYYNDGQRNHEIDIELPGNTRDFKFTLCTNWLTESRRTSQKDTPDFYHNDGEWHTYRFDWHTEPEQIDYYIDGELVKTATSHVPTASGVFQVGVWFPESWCGIPNFGTAYMLVDYVKYTRFDDEYEETGSHSPNTTDAQFPKEPIVLPVNNYVVDGEFETGTIAWSTIGDAARVENPNRAENKMLHVGKDSSVSQVIYSVNANSEYQITAAGLGVGTNAKVKVDCISLNSVKPLQNGTFELSFNGDAMTPQTLKFTTPRGTYRLRVTLYGEGDGDAYFDDVYLTQPCRGDFVLA